MSTVAHTAAPADTVAEPVRDTPAGASRWRSRLIRVVSVAAASALWQLLTVNDVRAGLRCDALPTVSAVV
ncbi:ABC transporter permease, partial [Nocardia farcinica]|nr:ABC transporter permease [Nocardia farcinica]